MNERIQPRRHAAGFTLIEVMIAVAIVAILAAIALPAYQESVLKGRRAEGRTALAELMQQQERFMTQNGAYSEFAVDASGVPFKTHSGDGASGASYKLKAEKCKFGAGADLPLEECVSISAIPQHTDAKAGTLTITSTGARTCSGNERSVCWK